MWKCWGSLLVSAWIGTPGTRIDTWVWVTYWSTIETMRLGSSRNVYYRCSKLLAFSIIFTIFKSCSWTFSSRCQPFTVFSFLTTGEAGNWRTTPAFFCLWKSISFSEIKTLLVVCCSCHDYGLTLGIRPITSNSGSTCWLTYLKAINTFSCYIVGWFKINTILII